MITKEMTIREVLTKGFSALLILKSYGLDCLQCPHSITETLEEGANRHNIDIEKLLKELNN